MVASAAIVEHQAETQSTTRAAGRIVLDPHVAAVSASDVSHVRQAEADAEGLGGASIVSGPGDDTSRARLDLMRHLHLTHPRLDFWVAVETHERDGRYMATADLGEDSRDVGVG